MADEKAVQAHARYRHPDSGQRIAKFIQSDVLCGSVIPPFLAGSGHRIHAANLSFWAGVMPQMAILGLSLL